MYAKTVINHVVLEILQWDKILQNVLYVLTQVYF